MEFAKVEASKPGPDHVLEVALNPRIETHIGRTEQALPGALPAAARDRLQGP